LINVDMIIFADRGFEAVKHLIQGCRHLTACS